jgi:hypothetical protein
MQTPCMHVDFASPHYLLAERDTILVDPSSSIAFTHSKPNVILCKIANLSCRSISSS